MIKIEIQCSPEDLDGHIAALGFMRNPVAALGVAPRVSMQETVPTIRYFYHPESDSLFTSDDGTRPVGDGLVEEIDKQQFEKLAARRSAEANRDTARHVHADSGSSVVDVIESMRAGPGPSAFATEMEAHERPSDLAAPPQDPSAKRVPGQPAPGRKRRTKEEMEEDYAYLTKHPGAFTTNTPRAGEPDDPRRAAISTGEARVDLAAAAQDETDEAAETAMRATGKPTMEDLRRAVAKWTEKVGSAAAIKDLRSIIGCAMIELPETEIGAAIGRVEAAINGSTVLGVPNLNGQPSAPEEAEIIETPKSTKEEVISAIMAYGKLYDGSTDPNVMPVTKEDLPKIFGRLFGNGVTGIGSMPVKSPEAFGQVFTAISAATRDNPFKREARA